MKPIESKRVALDRRIVLRFPDFDGFVTEFAANLSMTGMFVRSETPQRPGTPVAFELRLEDGAPLVRGSGWVVWSRERAEATDRPAGMGIEFTELDHKSRRLVRWMILNQLGEGEKPFEVRGEGGPGAPGDPAAKHRRRKAVRAAWRVPAVAGLLFVALAAFVLKGRLGLDGSAGAPPRDSQIVLADGPADVAMPPGGEFEEQDGNEAAVFAAIEAAVKSWAAAWSDQDVPAYLDHYATGFVPADGLSRSQWSAQRRLRLTTPASIRVAVTRLEITRVSAREARVTLLQTYRSDGYADTVDKVLELVLENGAWKIRRELAD